MEFSPDKEILTIAKEYFGVETLETRNMDYLDFYNIHIIQIAEALEKAYEIGYQWSNSKKSPELRLPDFVEMTVEERSRKLFPIAKECFRAPTLAERRSGEDMYDSAVWSIKKALSSALELGSVAGQGTPMLNDMTKLTRSEAAEVMYDKFEQADRLISECQLIATHFNLPFHAQIITS